MDERISVLKENQQLLGTKISLLQETNKKKGEEAEKIRELIAECRQNLDRIKCETMNASQRPESQPEAECRHKKRKCPSGEGVRTNATGGKQDLTCEGFRNQGPSDASYHHRSNSPCKSDGPSTNYRDKKPSPCGENQPRSPCAAFRDPCRDNINASKDPCESRTATLKTQISLIADAQDKSRQCMEKFGEKMEREVKMRIVQGNATGCSQFDPCECETDGFQERVSCRVDLSKMKVNIRGPPEDLKKLDAIQLINLLDKFQCQELIINTGDNESQLVGNRFFGILIDEKTEPDRNKFHLPSKMTFQYLSIDNSSLQGDVPVFYITHPGNLALIFGIAMVAFLVNANLCSTKRGCRTKLLLNMLYLGSFAFHYGIVLWMSFIRGLTLSMGLPRELFNTVDNLILPKYFSICVFLSAITLYSFLATHCSTPCASWTLPVIVQIIIKSTTFIIELITICYIVPAIAKLREVTDEYSSEDDDCPPPDSYCRNMEKLAKLNWTITIINTLTVMFMGSNLYYISTKLNFH